MSNTTSTIRWIPITERVPVNYHRSGGQRVLAVCNSNGYPVVMLVDVYCYGDEPDKFNAGRPDWMFSVPGWSKMDVSHWAELPDVTEVP